MRVMQRISVQMLQVRLINIVIVRRGNCSFTTKAASFVQFVHASTRQVKIAQAKGAHAVIIVDREDMHS